MKPHAALVGLGLRGRSKRIKVDIPQDSRRDIWHRRLHCISLCGTILILPFQMMAFNVFGYNVIDTVSWNISRLFPIIADTKPLFYILWSLFYLLGPSLLIMHFNPISRRRKIILALLLLLIIFPATTLLGAMSSKY